MKPTQKEARATVNLSMSYSLWERAERAAKKSQCPSLTAFIRQAIQEKLERIATEARATASEGD